jgi:hypothetical protein
MYTKFVCKPRALPIIQILICKYITAKSSLQVRKHMKKEASIASGDTPDTMLARGAAPDPEKTYPCESPPKAGKYP